MIRKYLASLLLTFVLLSCQSNAQQNDIAVDAFEKGIQKENIQILDVRTQNEYNSGHIKKSFLADWTKPEQFRERIKSLDKTKPVYTYCLSGGRSRAAADFLKKEGFKEVYNLEGGIVAWKNASLPVEGVEKTKQVTMEEYLAQLKSDKPVLVDIGAVWCPPCKKMEPVIKELIQSHGTQFKFVQIDGGVQESIIKELNASSFPTFIIYKNGKEVWRKEGIVSKEELLKNL
ncbi:MAG TPA: thioredoxin domain-containing protein [Flavisolibacter sp.]|nr:thioredoxin domain-containing protein [Flavisolibacter sp.]